MNLDHQLKQSEFGALVGISRQAVGDLQSRGIIEPGMSGAEALLAYCGHLRIVAAGRLAAGDLDLAEERAGLAKAQRERIEMQNAVTRRELAPVVLLEEVLAKAGSKVAGILDAIPGMIRRRNSALTSGDLEMISGEVARARNIAAALTLDDVLERRLENEGEPGEEEPLITEAVNDDI